MIRELDRPTPQTHSAGVASCRGARRGGGRRDGGRVPPLPGFAARIPLRGRGLDGAPRSRASTSRASRCWKPRPGRPRIRRRLRDLDASPPPREALHEGDDGVDGRAVAAGVLQGLGAPLQYGWVPYNTTDEGWFGRDTYTGGADKVSHFIISSGEARLLYEAYTHLGHPPEQSFKLADRHGVHERPDGGGDGRLLRVRLLVPGPHRRRAGRDGRRA